MLRFLIFCCWLCMVCHGVDIGRVGFGKDHIDRAPLLLLCELIGSLVVFGQGTVVLLKELLDIVALGLPVLASAFCA